MKGWPVARALVVLLILLLAGVPLYSLTRPRPEPSAGATQKSTAEKLTIDLTFTQPPDSFSLLFLGNEILAARKTAGFEFSTPLETPFPPEGIDLVLEAHWPTPAQKAGASIQVLRANGAKETQSVWGTKEVFEVLTFGKKKG